MEEVDATEEASEALEQMAKTVGFKLTTQQFELSGICTTCQNRAMGSLMVIKSLLERAGETGGYLFFKSLHFTLLTDARIARCLPHRNRSHT